MSNQLSGMRKAQEREILPAVDLFPQVEYTGRKINSAKFGPNTYNTNVDSMGKRYFHSNDLSNVTFKPLSTAESLAVACYDFANLAKPQIFIPNWLQAGLTLRASEGVWINPLRNAKGEIITEERELNKHLIPKRKVNSIYLLDGDTSFVPYDTFEQGVQEHEKFLKSGLARGLVYTAEKRADSLSPIANDTEYTNQVNVRGFDSVREPLVKVVSLGSDGYVNGGRLVVDGDWGGGCYGGFALGGLVSGEASA